VLIFGGFILINALDDGKGAREMEGRQSEQSPPTALRSSAESRSLDKFAPALR
jgi:hypothetical protein